jgi:hypothetical protein
MVLKKQILVLLFMLRSIPVISRLKYLLLMVSVPLGVTELLVGVEGHVEVRHPGFSAVVFADRLVVVSGVPASFVVSVTGPGAASGTGRVGPPPLFSVVVRSVVSTRVAPV